LCVLAAFTHTLNHNGIMEDTAAALQPLTPCLRSPAFWRRHMRLMAAPAAVVEPYWKEGGWGSEDDGVQLSRASVLLESFSLLLNNGVFKVGHCRKSA